MRLRALAVSTFLSLLPALAGDQVVRGQLLNGETGLPLEGAMIIETRRGGPEEILQIPFPEGEFWSTLRS